MRPLEYAECPHPTQESQHGLGSSPFCAGGKNVVDTRLIVHGVRKKKTRYHVRVNGGATQVLFVDTSDPPLKAAKKIALHMGTNPESVRLESIDGIQNVFCESHVMTKAQKARLFELAVCAPTVRDSRNVHGTSDAFFGHRATRQRGVLCATYKVPPVVLAKAVRAMTKGTRGLTFSSLGVVKHRSIARHSDPATSGTSAICTWGSSDVCLKTMSPVTHQLIPHWPVRDLVYFDSSLEHEVVSETLCTSVVAYSTRRTIDAQHAIELRSYAFPVCASHTSHESMTSNVTMSLASSWEDFCAHVSSDACHLDPVRLTGLCTPAEPPPSVIPRTPVASTADLRVPATPGPTISPTLPFVSRSPEDFIVRSADQLSGIGVIDNAEHSKLTQRAKDLQLGYQLKLVRALITLDAKLRKALRDEPLNKPKVLGVLQASMIRWRMQPGTDDHKPASGSAAARGRTPGGDDDSSWNEVKNKKKSRSQSRRVMFEEEPEAIKLCPSAWSIPVRQEEDYKLDSSAVYQIHSKAKLHNMSVDAIHSDHSVMAVAPFRLEVGFAPPYQLPLPFDIEQTGRRYKAHMSVWVHQLSPIDTPPSAPPEPISLSVEGTDAKSSVLSIDMQIDDLEWDTLEEAIKKPSRARQLLVSRVPKLLVPDLLDVFKLTKTTGRWASALIRVRDTAIPAFLALSGMNTIWLNTPRSWQDKTRIMWMRDQDDPSQPMPLARVRAALAELDDPLGIVSKQDGRTWSFAIRVRTEFYKRSQAQLQLDVRDTFFLQGLPTQVAEEAIEEVLDKIKWKGEVVPDSCRVTRGRASFTIKAKMPPAVNNFVIRVDNEQVQVRIISKKAHARASSLPPRLSKQKEATAVEAPSWKSALSGKFKKADGGEASKEDDTIVTQPPASQSAAASAQPNIEVEPPVSKIRWWKGARWTMEHDRWVKLDDQDPQRTGAQAAALGTDHDTTMEAEDDSRKRNQENHNFTRARPKRRTDEHAQNQIQGQLNQALAMVEVFKSMLENNGIAIPDHQAMDEDSDQDDDGEGFEREEWDDSPRSYSPFVAGSTFPSFCEVAGGYMCAWSTLGQCYAVMFKGLDPASWPHGASQDFVGMEAEQSKQLCDDEVDESSSSCSDSPHECPLGHLKGLVRRRKGSCLIGCLCMACPHSSLLAGLFLAIDVTVCVMACNGAFMRLDSLECFKLLNWGSPSLDLATFDCLACECVWCRDCVGFGMSHVSCDFRCIECGNLMCCHDRGVRVLLFGKGSPSHRYSDFPDVIRSTQVHAGCDSFRAGGALFCISGSMGSRPHCCSYHVRSDMSGLFCLFDLCLPRSCSACRCMFSSACLHMLGDLGMESLSCIDVCLHWPFVVRSVTIMGDDGNGKSSDQSDASSYYSSYYSSSSNSNSGGATDTRPGGMSCREDEDVDFSDGEQVCPDSENAKGEDPEPLKSPHSPISVKSVLHTEELGRPRDAEALPPFVDQAPVVAPVPAQAALVAPAEEEEELPSLSDDEDAGDDTEAKQKETEIEEPDDIVVAAGDHVEADITTAADNGPLLGATQLNEVSRGAECCAAEAGPEAEGTVVASEGLQGRITGGFVMPESKRGPWSEEELRQFDITEGKTHLGMAMEGVPLVSGTENELLCDIGPDIGSVRRRVLAHKAVVRTILQNNHKEFWDQCWMLVWGAKYRREADAEVLIDHFHA
eukprot:6492216-Amphidinium_carterae.1